MALVPRRAAIGSGPLKLASGRKRAIVGKMPHDLPPRGALWPGRHATEDRSVPLLHKRMALETRVARRAYPWAGRILPGPSADQHAVSGEAPKG